MSEFIRLLWTLIMPHPDSLSSDMVDLSHVLTRLIVLNDLSTVQVVAGRVSSVVLSPPDVRLEKVPYFSR